MYVLQYVSVCCKRFKIVSRVLTRPALHSLRDPLVDFVQPLLLFKLSGQVRSGQVNIEIIYLSNYYACMRVCICIYVYMHVSTLYVC